MKLLIQRRIRLRCATVAALIAALTGVACAGATNVATPTGLTGTSTPSVATEGPMPQDVLRSGELVAYEVCARSDNWLRPSLTDMRDVFTDRRFGDGQRPLPSNYSLYLRNFYWVRYPTAISANRELVAFSGSGIAPIASQPAPRCDYQALAAGSAQRGEVFESLWLVDYHIVATRSDGTRIVVQVEPASTTFEDVVFPYPPATGFQTPSLLDIVDTSGIQLFEEDAHDDAWQADAAGVLMFASIGGPGSPLAAALPASAAWRGPEWKLIAASDQTPAGRIAGFDGSGNELLSVAWDQARSAWQLLGFVDPQKDLHRLALAPNSAGVLIVRDNIPLP